MLAPSALMSSPEVLVARAWDQVLQNLRMLRELEDDWDGLGAEAPPPELVDKAEVFLEVFRRRYPALVPNRVLATPNASVQFEWQAGRLVMEAVIDGSGVAEFAAEEPGKPIRHWRETVENNNQGDSWGILHGSALTG